MPTPNYTALIIEDEKNITDFMLKALKSNGYRVITADSGKSGLSSHPYGNGRAVPSS